MGINFFDGFERSVLFRLTRVLALGLIFILLFGIIAGALAIYPLFGSSTGAVTANEVISSLKIEKSEGTSSTTESEGLDVNPKAKLKIPFVVQKYIGGTSNLTVLKSWVAELSPDETTEYLNELAATVSLAEKSDVDPLKAINEFHRIKSQRLAAARTADLERKGYVLALGATIAASLILIAQLSLILVLLAVERNTR
ncbi:MAG: hypothetical protein KC777_28570, partial [Cyanobacteria bacterium HKST-UBA02]|nr:hypothetical protein [Cyanobacteria bacterium HKST-UBA02]